MPPTQSVVSRLKIVWLNLWFWTVAPLVTAVFLSSAFVYVCLYGVVVRNRRKTDRLIRRTISRYGAIILRCPWPLVRVKFVDYAPGDTPPFVFVCNHPASSDGFLMACLPFECVQVLNIWPSKIPILKFIAGQAGYLKVREMSFEDFLAAGSKLLKEGCSIIAFPEGTRSGHRQMGPFHGSAFRLAQQNQVKIVPIVLAGNRDIPPRGSALLRPGRVVVSKLPAIGPEKSSQMTPFLLKNRVRETIQQHLAQNPE